MAEKIDLITVSYILGILSIVFAFFRADAGLVLGIIGLIQASKQKSTRAKKLNVIGIVLSAIFVIINLIALIFPSIITGLFPTL